MTHPLEGARAKIARAADHLEALDAALTRFIVDGGFQLPAERDPETGEFVYRMYSNLRPPVPPSPSTSVLVGDALHDLRSALDHTVWQLARAPSEANQFPIFSSPEGFQKKRKRYLRSVPTEHWAQIESYQPYPGRDQTLAILAALNDADKHRLLLPGATVIVPGKGRFRGSGIESLTVRGRDWAPYEDGAEVYRLTIEPAKGGGPVQVHAEVPHTVVFRHPDGDPGVSIQDLRIMRINVANIVESFAGAFA
jgi:hypothetical protein